MLETLLRIERHLEDSTHIYGVAGQSGGVHFWVTEYTIDGQARKFGGVEFHSRTQIYGNETPDNESCWLLGGPCWHDGSSLLAEEQFIPLYNLCCIDGDMEPLWSRIERQYRSWKKDKIEVLDD